VRKGVSVSADEAKNCSEKKEETDYLEIKCCYELLGLRKGDEEVEESNCW
jgi:hypothetical protein